MRRPPSDVPLEVIALGSQGASGTQRVFNSSGWMTSVQLCNDSGVAAAMTMIDGGDSDGGFLGRFLIPAGSDKAFNPAAPGWPVTSGLIVVITGILTYSIIVERPNQ